REIERPRAAGLAETQAQRARAERRKVEADALPVRAVAVELGNDIARLAPRSDEDARELGVDDQRRLVVAARSRLGHAVEQGRRVERGADEIGAPATFRTPRNSAPQIGLAEGQFLQLDLLQIVPGRVECRREAQIDPASLDRGIADAAQMI